MVRTTSSKHTFSKYQFGNNKFAFFSPHKYVHYIVLSAILFIHALPVKIMRMIFDASICRRELVCVCCAIVIECQEFWFRKCLFHAAHWFYIRQSIIDIKIIYCWKDGSKASCKLVDISHSALFIWNEEKKNLKYQQKEKKHFYQLVKHKKNFFFVYTVKSATFQFNLLVIVFYLNFRRFACQNNRLLYILLILFVSSSIFYHRMLHTINENNHFSW